MLLDPYTWHRVRIRQLVRESTDAVSFRVDVPPDYHYASGQHAIVRAQLPDGSMPMRQYSFSSSPLSGELWFTVVRTPDGMLSTWCVRDANIGGIIEISQPFNGPLAVHPTPGQRICMIGGGSGIAPLMSHLRTLRLDDGHHTDITLLYSTRSTSGCFAAELAPRPHETIIRRETDMAGRFTDDELCSYAKDCDAVYICGSRQFVMAMRQALEPVIPSENVLSEAFSLT